MTELRVYVSAVPHLIRCCQRFNEICFVFSGAGRCARGGGSAAACCVTQSQSPPVSGPYSFCQDFPAVVCLCLSPLFGSECSSFLTQLSCLSPCPLVLLSPHPPPLESRVRRGKIMLRVLPTGDPASQESCRGTRGPRGPCPQRAVAAAQRLADGSEHL